MVMTCKLRGGGERHPDATAGEHTVRDLPAREAPSACATVAA